jgi:hypothetical protein
MSPPLPVGLGGRGLSEGSWARLVLGASRTARTGNRVREDARRVEGGDGAQRAIGRTGARSGAEGVAATGAEAADGDVRGIPAVFGGELPDARERVADVVDPRGKHGLGAFATVRRQPVAEGQGETAH